LSQPSHPPVAGAPGSDLPLPAAPTQIGFPGQVQYAQPQYAPTPQQQPAQQFASGFPNYVSPPPSPANTTSLVVGSVVVVLVLLFAVLGFVIVA
jgi:hypothetical protein